MKQAILFITALFLTYLTFAQAPDVWVRFHDTSTESSGYKDLKGNVKLPPRYVGFTRADTFHNIIAVTERIDNSYNQYYLLKKGKKVGKDSVFVFDFRFDCESEGKILFKDWKSDRVGFLDSNGIPIIPGMYNAASPFQNGIDIALRNAKRKCWDRGGDTTNCEHLGWEGGESILINEKNEVLADGLNVELRSINWYSKKINGPSPDTGIYVNIAGTNGITYRFIDFDKEFRKWFSETFLHTLKSNGKLEHLLFDEITFWSPKDGWTSLERTAFHKTFPTAITTKRFQPRELKEVYISQNFFNDLIFQKDIYKKYLNSCGEHNSGKYPLYEVMVTYKKKRQKPVSEDAAVESISDFDLDYQEHFEFLRTENGYKLFSVSLKR